MPYSRALGWPSMVAGGTIAPSVGIKLDTTADQVVQATSGDALIGVMQLGQRDTPGLTGSDSTIAAIVGDTNFDFYVRGDWCQVQALAAFTAGQWWKASTGGKAVPHTTGTAFCGGQVRDTANAGELIHTLFDPQLVTLP